MKKTIRFRASITYAPYEELKNIWIETRRKYRIDVMNSLSSRIKNYVATTYKSNSKEWILKVSLEKRAPLKGEEFVNVVSSYGTEYKIGCSLFKAAGSAYACATGFNLMLGRPTVSDTWVITDIKWINKELV